MMNTAPINALRRIPPYALALCWLLALCGGMAHAQFTCEVGSTALDVDFGIYQGSTIAVSSPGAWNFRCKNNTNQSFDVKICAGLGPGSMGLLDGMRRMEGNTAADSLRYELYRDPALTQVYGLPPNDGIETTATVPAQGEVDIPTTFRIYGQLPGGQTVPPGVYSSTFSGGHVQARFRRYPTGSPELACGGSAMAYNFTVRAQVPHVCEIEIQQHVDFGTRTTLAAPVDALGRLRVRCTAGSDYSIAMNDGQHAENGQRRMRHAAGGEHLVLYELYRDSARTQRWGSASGERQYGTGTGDPQAYGIYARTPGGQTITSTGTYRDTVVVTVEY